jgi:hypothetical protein
MKLNSITLFVILLLSLSNFQCQKDKNNTENFCERPRAEYLTISNKEGTIVYSEKYKRYGISFTITISNNIDTQIIGYVCNLNAEFQSVGLPVTASGILKYFNADENMIPEVAGQNIYFFELTQIAEKL